MQRSEAVTKPPGHVTESIVACLTGKESKHSVAGVRNVPDNATHFMQM